MYKFIQRNQKKMLAVFGVILMIAFIVPATVTQNTFGDPVEGTLAGDGGKIRLSDKKRADSDINVLSRHGLLPLALGLAPYEVYSRPEMAELAGRLRQELEQSPELWVMLVREAEQAGIQPAASQVDDAIKQHVDPATTTPEEIEDLIEPAVRRLLMVRSSFQRFANSMKATKPLIQSELVYRQGLLLNLVELKAEDFVEQVPAPTPEQVRTHYEQYRDTLPALQGATFGTTQPVRSGYRVSDRAKVQYVQIPAEAVVDTFLKTKLNDQERYQLKIAANLYHRANPLEFQFDPTTQPAATGPATQPATRPAGSTTRPLAEVEPQIIPRLVRGELSVEGNFPRVRESVEAVQKRFIEYRNTLRDDLRERLQKDYVAHRGPTSAPATRPTTGPATGPSAEPLVIQPIVGTGDPFEQVDYLKKVAEEFEKKHGVRPLVNSVANEWQTEEQLRALPGIGTAIANTPSAESFAALALRRGERPGGPTTQPTREEARLFEPSPVLTDRQENAFIFRVTAWHPEHVPPLDEVREQVVKDLRLIAAYDRAREEARKLLEAAGALGGASTQPTTAPATAPAALAAAPTTGPADGRLPAVARAAGRNVLTVGPVQNLAGVAQMEKSGAAQQFQVMQQVMQLPIPGYEFTGPFSMAKLNFIRAIAPLLEQVTPSQPHLGKVIELPGERKVLAVEVADLVLDWTEEEDHRRRLMVAQQAEQTLEFTLAARWFDRQDVIRRVGYTPANEDEPTTQPAGQ